MLEVGTLQRQSPQVALPEDSDTEEPEGRGGCVQGLPAAHDSSSGESASCGLCQVPPPGTCGRDPGELCGLLAESLRDPWGWHDILPPAAKPLVASLGQAAPSQRRREVSVCPGEPTGKAAAIVDEEWVPVHADPKEHAFSRFQYLQGLRSNQNRRALVVAFLSCACGCAGSTSAKPPGGTFSKLPANGRSPTGWQARGGGGRISEAEEALKQSGSRSVPG